MIVDAIRVQRIEAVLAEWRADARAARRNFDKRIAKKLEAMIGELEAALVIDPDLDVDRETARKSGLSDKSLNRRPHTGTGRNARWKLRDLVRANIADFSADESESNTSDVFIRGRVEREDLEEEMLRRAIREAA